MPQSDPPVLILATAGHVDHGKTALVRALTGTDTDTLAAEKARGLTISPGYAYMTLDTVATPGAGAGAGPGILGFVDLPGHIDFINNMLAGSAGVDGALLAVAADDGIMPQTREHLAIIDLLGLTRGLAIITKSDRVAAGRVEELTAELAALLAGTGLAGMPILPVSNTSGAGLAAVRTRLGRLFAAPPPDPFAPFTPLARFLIDRSFTVKGAGTVVTGTLRAGVIREGDSLRHSATGREARVRGLRLDRQSMSAARRGRIALNITLSHETLGRGDYLHHPALRRSTNCIDARLRFLDNDFEPRPKAGYHLHIAASHQVVSLRLLGAAAGDGQRYVRLRLPAAIHACHGDRLILRDPPAGTTLGGGVVIDPAPPPRGAAGQRRLAELEAMDRGHADALRALAQFHPQGLRLDDFARVRNLEVASVVTHARQQGRTEDWRLLSEPGRGTPLLLHETHFARWRQLILATLGDWHRAKPAAGGLDEAALRQALAATHGAAPQPAFPAGRSVPGKPVESAAALTAGSRPEFPAGVSGLGKPKGLAADHAAAPQPAFPAGRSVPGKPVEPAAALTAGSRPEFPAGVSGLGKPKGLAADHAAAPRPVPPDETAGLGKPEGLAAAHAAAPRLAPSALPFGAVGEQLLATGEVVKSGTLWRLAGHQAAVSEEIRQFRETVRPLLARGGRVPPRTRELAEAIGIPLRQLELVLRQAVRAGELVKVADNRHYLPEMMADLAERVAAVARQAGEGGFTVIDFRAATGIGRNLCIEILEHFDRAGYTRRAGNQRFLRRAPGS